MELKIKTTAHLKQEDVKMLITAAMEKQMPGYKVKSVRFIVNDTSDDRFGRGSSSYDLTGIDVEMEPIPSHG